MIGSLLYFVLYPLSRSVTSLFSDNSKKAPSPAAVNDRAVWDGGAGAATFTNSQTALLDQKGEAKGEAKERVDKQVKEENNKRPDMYNNPQTEVLHTDSKNYGASRVSNGHSAQREEAGDSKQEDLKMSVHPNTLHLKADMEDDELSTADDTSQELVLLAHIQGMRVEDSMRETTRSVEEQLQTYVESVPPLQEEKIQHSNMEVWDEYLLSTAAVASGGLDSSKLGFSPLPSKTETHVRLSEQQNEQSGWHFPVGPGLADEMQCPRWNFPAASYYPELEVPFEVMWRVWENLDATEEPSPTPIPLKEASMDFTVMSYNILAQDLLEINQHLYVHCPLDVLDWSFRCTLLLNEIAKWAPDILCLQEVQENHYHEQLHPVFSEMGYTCVYKRRTGTKTDGCAVCYRSSHFSQAAVTELEFFRPETELLDRHNVGILLLLRPLVTEGAEVKEKGPPLCVANTHLLFNPRRGDVKLTQLAMMLAEIDAMVKSCKGKGEHCNVILCGDFNSLPHMPLYNLITSGELYYQGLPAWMVSGQEDLSYKPSCRRLFAPLWPSSLGITDRCQYTTVNDMFDSQSQKSGKYRYSHDLMLRLRYCPAACVRPKDLELIPGVTDNTSDASREDQHCEQGFRRILRNRLDLESVYKHVLHGSGSPEVTTLHSEGGATVDYIFYTPKRIRTSDQKGREFAGKGLKLIGSLSLLSEDVLWSINGLPSHIFPSDHLSLVARFQMDLNS
ncbi:protein angel homolog 1 isoform 1-T1 [Menidia menidia]